MSIGLSFVFLLRVIHPFDLLKVADNDILGATFNGSRLGIDPPADRVHRLIRLDVPANAGQRNPVANAIAPLESIAVAFITACVLFGQGARSR